MARPATLATMIPLNNSAFFAAGSGARASSLDIIFTRDEEGATNKRGSQGQQGSGLLVPGRAG